MPRPLRTAWISACLVVMLVSCAPKAAPPPPPTAVKVATVLQQDVPVYLEAIGEARGNTEIEIRARVTGYLETVEFQEGSMVTRGQRLYTLDRAPFEAKLAQARGQLAEAEAQLARARQDVVRFEPLVAKNAISRQEYETSVALRARGRGRRRRRAGDRRIGPDRARLHHGDGAGGRPHRQDRGLSGDSGGPGQQHAADAHLAHRPDSRPLHPGGEGVPHLFRRQEVLKAGGAEVPKVPIRLVLADGSELPDTGLLVFVDRAVEATTGTILLEAAFPNAEPDGPARSVRADPGDRRAQEGRDSGTAARGAGDAGDLQRRRRRSGQHHRDAHGEARGTGGRALGHRLRPPAGGPDRGRRPAEGPARNEGRPGDGDDRRGPDPGRSALPPPPPATEP